MKSPLDQITDELFESELGVKGEVVTLEYIRSHRRDRHYPVDRESEYGGRIDDHHEHVTDGDVEDAHREIDTLVEEYASQ